MMETVCFGFDGTLTQYSGWKGADVCEDPPVGGIGVLLSDLSQTHRIIICSSRAAEPGGKACIEDWLKRYGLDGWVSEVTAVKPPAVACVDDQAVVFHGEVDELADWIRNIRPWHRKMWRRREDQLSGEDRVI